MFLYIMIAIKAKELISEVREVAVMVHQQPESKMWKELGVAMCQQIFLGFFVPKGSVFYSIIYNFFAHLVLVPLPSTMPGARDTV